MEMFNLMRCFLLFAVWIWKSDQLVFNPVGVKRDGPVGGILTTKFDVDSLTLAVKHLDNNQTIMAHLEEEGDCIYKGHIVGCTTSRVLVTGCVTEVQSVQIQSLVFGDFLFTTLDGVVKPVELITQVRRKRGASEDIDYDYDDGFENPEFDSQFPLLLFDTDGEAVEEIDPPEQFLLNINVYLDSLWESSFGRLKQQDTVLGILKHTKLLWQHRSLSTKLDIQYNVFDIHQSSQHLLPTKRNYNEKLLEELVGPAKVDGHSTAHVYLTAPRRGEYSRVLGYASLNSMCGDDNSKPRVMAVYKESEIRTAMTVAHEIGHLLGIYHDFMTGRRGHKCGDGKMSGGLVMNYGGNRVEWSNCSNQDFKTYYNRINTITSFCLKETKVLERSCSWNDWSTWRPCSATCGEGFQRANRSVAQEATGGGDPCEGEKEKTQKCTETACPKDCSWNEWSSWSSCSATCGEGWQWAGRSVAQEAVGGGDQCEGENDRTKKCLITACPTDCSWNEWSRWSSCSATCGDGSQKAYRIVAQKASGGGKVCGGKKERTQKCIMFACPTDSFPTTLTVSSDQGPAGEARASYMGVYNRSEDYYGNKPVWTNWDESRKIYYNAVDATWWIGSDYTHQAIESAMTGLDSPMAVGAGWQYYTGDVWNADTMLTVTAGHPSYPHTVMVTSSGPAGRRRPKSMGVFTMIEARSRGRPVWRNENNEYFFYSGFWLIGPQLDHTTSGWISSVRKGMTEIPTEWEYWNGGSWTVDQSIKLWVFQ